MSGNSERNPESPLTIIVRPVCLRAKNIKQLTNLSTLLHNVMNTVKKIIDLKRSPKSIKNNFLYGITQIVSRRGNGKKQKQKIDGSEDS